MRWIWLSSASVQGIPASVKRPCNSPARGTPPEYESPGKGWTPEHARFTIRGQL
jgi:hypothetical protein